MCGEGGSVSCWSVHVSEVEANIDAVIVPGWTTVLL